MSDAQPTETWKPVEGFEGHDVSSLGRVRRWFGGYPLCHGGYRKPYWKPLKPTPNGKGYMRVSLRRNAESCTRYVHRLVAAAFIGPTPQGAEVNHKDLNKSNNNADNLEYVTHLENNQHAAANGAHRHGADHHFTRFTEDEVREMRRLKEAGMKIGDIARQFNTHYATVKGICNRTRWVHLT